MKLTNVDTFIKYKAIGKQDTQLLYFSKLISSSKLYFIPMALKYIIYRADLNLLLTSTERILTYSQKG